MKYHIKDSINWVKNMYTKEEILNFFIECNVTLLSIESEPRKAKYNREVQIVVQCCVDGCDNTVTKSFRNHHLSKNFGCSEHYMSLKTQKFRETHKHKKGEKVEGSEETKNEVINETHEHDGTEGSSDIVIIDDIKEPVTLHDPIELTEDLKTQFLSKHYFFEYMGQAWTRANDVARFLEFKEARNIIYYHISEADKIPFKQFPACIQNVIISGIGYHITDRLHPETMFINDEGVFELFMKSHKPIAKAMKRCLVYDVIPSIIKTGTYSITPMPIAQSAIQTVTAVTEPHTTVCHNLHGFPISSMKSAIYILQLPLLNMYKFGYSNNVINRLKQHESDFSEITIQLVIEVPDAQEIERRLKTEI